MPLFDFTCRSCGARFEELMRGSDRDEDVECKACGAREAERLLSAPAAVGGAAAGGGGGGCSPRGGFT
jgi:putative FmdB family regulatory protein